MRFDTMSVIDVPPGNDPVGQREPARKKILDTMEQFVASEKLGFEGAWISEHHFGGESVSASMPTLLTHIAARTTTLRIGSAISVLPLSDPIRLAEDYATIDVLSGGRLDFGIGIGNRARESKPFGIEPETMRERFYESYEIIKRAWTEDIVNFKGKYYEANALTLFPKPVQSPTPPIYQPVASDSTMKFVAKEGLIPMHAGNPDRIVAFHERYRKAMQEEGFTEDEIKVAVKKIYWQVFTYVAPTQAEAKERGPAHHAEWWNTCVRADEWGAEHLGVDLTSPWSVKALGSALLWDNPEKAWDARQSLSGDPSYVIDWIAELRDMGVEHLTFLCNMGTTTHEEAMRSMTLLSESVLPHFK